LVETVVDVYYGTFDFQALLESKITYSYTMKNSLFGMIQIQKRLHVAWEGILFGDDITLQVYQDKNR